MKTMTLTPAMQQYYDIKEKYPDTILFFRMGDFYEMFDDDAEIAHKILWIAITTRNKNAENPTPLAGIPFHAKDKYLPELVAAGYKVAIAEQVSDPKAKGIVQREVVRVITPGTLMLEGESYENTHMESVILSLVEHEGKYALSKISLSNSSWEVSEFKNFDDMLTQLYKTAPQEVVLDKAMKENEKLFSLLQKKYKLNIYFFSPQKNSYQFLTEKLWSKNLVSNGIEGKNLAQKASAMILEYLISHQKSDFSFLSKLKYISFENRMQLDESTIQSLDLVYNFATQSQSIGTLFWALDETKTRMGKRYLRSQILSPLWNREEIQKRQKFIEIFKSDPQLLDSLRKELASIADMDAILSRLSLWRAGPRELLRLKKSLQSLQSIIAKCTQSSHKELHDFFR